MSKKLLVVVLLTGFATNAQQIDGFWLKIREPNEIPIGSPFISIIEFSKDSIFTYDYTSPFKKAAITFKGNKIIYNDSISGHYTLTENNVLKIESVLKDSSTAFTQLVKLFPTLIQDRHILDEIKNFEFEVQFNDFVNKIVFDKPLDFDEMIHLKQNKIIGDTVHLENWNEIFFVSFYLMGNRIYVFPIREINKDSMVIYGIPGELDKDVIAIKKKK